MPIFGRARKPAAVGVYHEVYAINQVGGYDTRPLAFAHELTFALSMFLSATLAINSIVALFSNFSMDISNFGSPVPWMLMTATGALTFSFTAKFFSRGGFKGRRRFLWGEACRDAKPLVSATVQFNVLADRYAKFSDPRIESLTEGVWKVHNTTLERAEEYLHKGNNCKVNVCECFEVKKELYAATRSVNGAFKALQSVTREYELKAVVPDSSVNDLDALTKDVLSFEEYRNLAKKDVSMLKENSAVDVSNFR